MLLYEQLHLQTPERLSAKPGAACPTQTRMKPPLLKLPHPQKIASEMSFLLAGKTPVRPICTGTMPHSGSGGSVAVKRAASSSQQLPTSSGAGAKEAVEALGEEASCAVRSAKGDNAQHLSRRACEDHGIGVDWHLRSMRAWHPSHADHVLLHARRH